MSGPAFTKERQGRMTSKRLHTLLEKQAAQADYIGWPLLAESFRRDLAALDARPKETPK